MLQEVLGKSLKVKREGYSYFKCEISTEDLPGSSWWNDCNLAKLYHAIKFFVCVCLVLFYGILNLVGYLMPNPVYTYIYITYDL